jgi:hypothetical protein
LNTRDVNSKKQSKKSVVKENKRIILSIRASVAKEKTSHGFHRLHGKRN